MSGFSFYFSLLLDEFDAEDVKGSWGSKKKYFYGGNPNEKVKKSGGKDIEEDENELVKNSFFSTTSNNPYPMQWFELKKKVPFSYFSDSFSSPAVIH